MTADVGAAVPGDDTLLEYWNDNKIHYNGLVTMTTVAQ
jgi:hypothetical protein